jgi:hypothetical protein
MGAGAAYLEVDKLAASEGTNNPFMSPSPVTVSIYQINFVDPFFHPKATSKDLLLHFLLSLVDSLKMRAAVVIALLLLLVPARAGKCRMIGSASHNSCGLPTSLSNFQGNDAATPHLQPPPPHPLPAR